MKVVIVGEGGREHALVWKSAQSPLVSQIFALPGNAGTATEDKATNIDIKVDDVEGISQFCVDEGVDLCIIGPEVPLVLGLSDELKSRNIACFGPSKEAARLEGSKVFAKDFLERHGIPTARYASFVDVDEAKRYVEMMGTPIVIKADGLAAGKGVIIAEDQAQAFEALNDILTDSQFGDAGASVVIEEFLHGEEASFICMADGQSVVPLATSQDHKAAYEDDTGPNTGGMGAYSPAPVVDDVMHERIMSTIIHPTLNGLAAEGMPYTGFLYAGVMIDAQGTPKVLEFNCRMGDPETQPIMMRLQSDLVSHCLAATKQMLQHESLQWSQHTALGVVLASEGYPGSYTSGKVISMPTEQSQAKVFYAGVKQQDEQLLTSGGRVLCVCALGESTLQAQTNAYQSVSAISWDGMWYRRDIGHKAIARENKP